MDGATIASVLAALGVGTWIATLLERGSQSRHFRAGALRALANTEARRWAPQDEGWPGLRAAIHELESAALVARVPASLVRQYAYLARVAWNLSSDSWEQYPDPEVGGGVSSEIADVVRGSAKDVSDAIWSPWRGRVTQRRKVRATDARVSHITNRDVVATLHQFQGHEHSPF